MLSRIRQSLLLLLPPLSQGQRVEVGDGQGHTFTYTPLVSPSVTPLHEAASKGHTETVALL